MNGREWLTAFHTVALCTIELDRQDSEKKKKKKNSNEETVRN